ncbi:MAG: hypothetical protein AAGG44_02770, partial [Planctomycetota bacterium]
MLPYRMNPMVETLLLAQTLVLATASIRPVAASDLETDLAEIDAAATMFGSIGSWIRNEPEAAVHAFQQEAQIRKYLQSKRAEHDGVTTNRLQDRMAQIDSGFKSWEDAVSRMKRDMPKQIATELKRQSDAVERFLKSKSPRASSFAYIPKTVWQTKDKLDVLTAAGHDTNALVAQQKKV